mgnify:CR=1 FL=1
MLAGMIGAGVMVAVIVFFSYYKVDTVEYLMTGKEDEQKEKDNTDLKQKYRELEELLRSDSMKPVRYDGKPVNNDTIDLLLKQIEISLAMLKK